ncbi:glycoside hydrolase family 20 zincin-like fold domain-containing protein [Urechidicola vernalis]|uniref:beta-N-acetylhexosaminidase n=1 Tax=Urechidicola vernalis TaxID=3075600 RepID=A0ABU2YA13_9FLAO|nr:glycoside hydrolase family 20 zincin-like fold domain-containing protein [Urechidicola sp. P050]MDT0553903.1 glycoside hydrolase family 20 zincin-like fold domain-containing protein [Urechidicola sp. P050]
MLKSHILRVLFAILIGFNNLSGFSQNNAKFEILPSPQRFEITGQSSIKFGEVKKLYADNLSKLPVHGTFLNELFSVNNEADADLVYRIDSTIQVDAEGYTLSINNNKIVIVGKDEAGLFYGVKSLEQLLEDAKDQKAFLPNCTITDFPKLKYRSIQLDIKHHLEKKSYYYDLMDYLAGLKVNAIIVEMEDKLKYEKHPLIGSDDGFTIEEWAELSNYANDRNIEISPLIQGLGHASFILKHDKYKALRDDPKSDWAFNPLDPRTYELQFDLYREAIKATPNGKYLHIGGDEVHTTGKNSGRSALDLQLEWLRKVCKFAEENNRIPIFWDDMPLKQAGVYKPMFNKNMTQEEVDEVWEKNEHKLVEFLDQFPKNCIYMRWNYHTPEALGNTKAMEWFRAHDLQVMGATAGQTRWVLMPQRESNIKEIKTFALSSIESGLNGLLLTLWDDDSPHFELYKRGINAFSEYTWSGDKRSKSELKSVFRHRQFSFETSGNEFSFIDNLEKPVGIWKNILLNGNKRNYLKGNENAIEKFVIDLPTEKKGVWSDKNKERIENAENTLKTCSKIESTLDKMKSEATRNSYTLEIYEQVNKLVQFSSNAVLKLRDYDKAQDKEEERMALEGLKLLSKEFTALRTEFEAVYGKTRVLNKPENYILDQDDHVHLSNQSLNFDWQFYAELLFLEKLEQLF